MRYVPLILGFEDSELTSLCNSLQTYLNSVHNLARKEVKTIEQNYNDLVAKNPGNEHEIADYMEEEYDMYKNSFVKFSNDSVFLTAYSFLEGRLKQLRDLLKEGIITPVSPTRSLKGLSDIERYFYEIQDLSGLPCAVLNSVWSKLKDYKRIRVLITHHNSNIMYKSGTPLTGQADYPLITRYTNIELKTTGEFEIDEEFVRTAIEDIKKFLVGLVKELKTIPLSNLK